jgi:TetR/AcrR family transcriptional repressor of mexJK operon
MAQLSKRDAILRVAGDLFVAHGFRKVSIDQIVEAVPISRPTLYAHFKDKRALYSAVINARCGALLADMRETVKAGRSVEQTLFDIGYQFLGMVLSEPALQMHRTLAAEVAEFPEVAKLFYYSGPDQMHRFLSDYLAKQHKKKTLRVRDADLSADMFLSSIKGYIHLQRLLGIAAPLTKKQMKSRVEYALDIFLKAHAR